MIVRLPSTSIRIQLFIFIPDILICYHWIRDTLENKLLSLEKIHTDRNGSNMLTKALSRDKTEVCRQMENLVKPPHQLEGKDLLGSAHIEAQ